MLLNHCTQTGAKQDSEFTKFNNYPPFLWSSLMVCTFSCSFTLKKLESFVKKVLKKRWVTNCQQDPTGQHLLGIQQKGTFGCTTVNHLHNELLKSALTVCSRSQSCSPAEPQSGSAIKVIVINILLEAGDLFSGERSGRCTALAPCKTGCLFFLRCKRPFRHWWLNLNFLVQRGHSRYPERCVKGIGGWVHGFDPGRGHWSGYTIFYVERVFGRISHVVYAFIGQRPYFPSDWRCI